MGYKIATLLYCFNSLGDVLLLERAREPNHGLWSPPGGKLLTEIGESPYACACREAAEELSISITYSDLHLLGMVAERGSVGHDHWLMFLFEVLPRINEVPPLHPEGRFSFFSRAELETIPLPRTDREQIWPLVWRHRHGFFAAHCVSNPTGQDDWILEESRP